MRGEQSTEDEILGWAYVDSFNTTAVLTMGH